VLQRSVAVLELASTVAAKGLQSSLSDAGVAALTAHACAEGAYYNVMINLKGLEASDFTRATRAEAGAALGQARRAAQAIADQVTQTLAG
jgi:formiminotetrahydrofolate cyclodeaminase